MARRAYLTPAFLTVAYLSLPQFASAAVLATHRAVYDLTPLKIEDGAPISGATGRLAYELNGSACDGWTVNFRVVTSYDYRGDTTRVFDTQSTSWETADSKDYNYSEKEYVDNVLLSSQRITVKRSSADQPGQGVLNIPEKKDFTIPADAIFPSLYQLKLIDVAQQGQSRDVTLVYDGTDNENTTRAIATIGKKIDPAHPPASGQPLPEAFANLASWPVTIAYYNTTKNAEDTPIYQVSLRMFENGASTDLVMDYGEFTMKGTLTKFDMLPQEVCK